MPSLGKFRQATDATWHARQVGNEIARNDKVTVEILSEKLKTVANFVFKMRHRPLLWNVSKRLLNSKTYSVEHPLFSLVDNSIDNSILNQH